MDRHAVKKASSDGSLYSTTEQDSGVKPWTIFRYNGMSWVLVVVIKVCEISDFFFFFLNLKLSLGVM